MSDALTVYRAEYSTNCERIALALAHKELEAESVIITYSDRSPVEAISGQSLVPVIVDGDRVVNDSVAILRHLDRRDPSPPLFPTDQARKAEVGVFISWFEQVWKRPPNEIEDELSGDRPDQARITELSAEIAARLDLFEGLLTDRDFLFGEFGAADCVAYPFLKYALGREPGDEELFHRILDDHLVLDDHHRSVRGWIERAGALPRAF